MKVRFAVFAATAASVVTLGLAPASAPAACSSIGCLNSQMAKLQHRLKVDERTIASNNRVIQALVGCLKEQPVSGYGDSKGTFGYVFNPGKGKSNVNVTALDFTNAGDSVDLWVMFDSCNHSKKITFMGSNALFGR